MGRILARAAELSVMEEVEEEEGIMVRGERGGIGGNGGDGEAGLLVEG